MPDEPSFEKNRVIVVTASDIHFAEDKKALTELGIKVGNRFSSGLAALDFVKYNPIQLIVADAAVRDMEVGKFLRLLKQDLLLQYIPVIVISSESSRQFVVEVVSSGCTGFVVRPYRLETLAEHVQMARELIAFNEIEEEQLGQADRMVGEGSYDEAIEHYKEIVQTEEDQAQKYFDMGMAYLARKKWGKAIIAFNKSIKLNQMFIKAYKGLARAYKGKGDMEAHQYYLKKAADEFARVGEFQEVKDLFAEIVKYDEHAPNPYNTLGIQLRKQKKYHEALAAYEKALELDPTDENILYNMAKALRFGGEEKRAVDSLDQALQINPAHGEARALFKEISGKEWSGSEAEVKE